MEFLGNTISALFCQKQLHAQYIDIFSWKQELHNKSLQGCSAYFKINGSKIEVNHQKKKKKSLNKKQKLDPKSEQNFIKLYSLITRP